jgi:iron(III) transport system permease protein
MSTVLPNYITNTILLMIGVTLLASLFGITTAWITARYSFKFSGVIDLIIILPAACPAYLVAYAYTDFFEYAGPVQGVLRTAMGWTTPSDYFFPEIRSLGGAIFVLSSVLYPYVYLLSRTAFRQIPESLLEVTSLYNRSSFWGLSLPLARPAISAGIALVCMEVISDFGTVEYFSLETLTLGIFNVWIGMNSITAAAQLATFCFIFIVSLLALEMISRSGRRFNDTSKSQRSSQTTKITGSMSVLFLFICIIPVCFGFFIPITILMTNAMSTITMSNTLESLLILKNTLLVSLLGSFLVMSTGTICASVAKLSEDKKLQNLSRISATGYAFPGTILAIGIIVFVGYIDQILGNIGFGKYLSGFHISGTISVLLFAYLIRFLAVGYGSVISGLEKTSPNLIWASRTLGINFLGTISSITIPLIRPSIIAGGVLVFVDIMKELPMTLLLRPFNFDTLATHTYQFAHDELMGQASLPALMIIFAGLIPVFFLNKILRNYY